MIPKLLLEIISFKIIEVFCTLVNWKLKSKAIEAIGLFDRKTITVHYALRLTFLNRLVFYFLEISGKALEPTI